MANGIIFFHLKYLPSIKCNGPNWLQREIQSRRLIKLIIFSVVYLIITSDSIMTPDLSAGEIGHYAGITHTFHIWHTQRWGAFCIVHLQCMFLELQFKVYVYDPLLKNGGQVRTHLTILCRGEWSQYNRLFFHVCECVCNLKRKHCPRCLDVLPKHNPQCLSSLFH